MVDRNGDRRLSYQRVRLSAHAFALDVLVSRYAELDLAGALAAAEKTGMPPPLRAPVHQKWFKASPDAALASTTIVSPPPADSNFEISPLRSNGTGDQNPPH